MDDSDVTESEVSHPTDFITVRTQTIHRFSFLRMRIPDNIGFEYETHIELQDLAITTDSNSAENSGIGLNAWVANLLAKRLIGKRINFLKARVRNSKKFPKIIIFSQIIHYFQPQSQRKTFRTRWRRWKIKKWDAHPLQNVRKSKLTKVCQHHQVDSNKELTRMVKVVPTAVNTTGSTHEMDQF